MIAARTAGHGTVGRSSPAPGPGPTPGADRGELAARLRLSAVRLARLLRRQSGSGLTPSQISILASVSRLGPLTLGELADAERVAPPSITRAAAKLVDDGLLERQADESDRRVVRVRLTDAARALLDETRHRKTTWLVAQLDRLSDDERHRLGAALDVLERLAGIEP